MSWKKKSNYKEFKKGLQVLRKNVQQLDEEREQEVVVEQELKKEAA